MNLQLGMLQDNGGPTLTMAPVPGSLLIDQGYSAGEAADQRGRPRTYDMPGVPSAALGDGTDIGAVEIGPLNLVVTNTLDTGAGSLRAAVQVGDPGDLITFASNVVGTLVLSNGPLAIQRDLMILGPGAGVLAISGNNNHDVIEVLSGIVGLSGLTITAGKITGSPGGFEANGGLARGGGVFNQSTLALNNCIISNCTAIGGTGGSTGSGFAGNGGNAQGGGILNIGTLSMTNCSIVASTATGGAGGTATSGGSPGSGGQGYGGGLYSLGSLTLVRCSVTGNNAAGGTGGGGAGSGSGGGLANRSTAASASSIR